MSTPLARLGRTANRRRRLVIAVWAVVLVAVVVAVGLVGRATTETVRIPGSDSQAALDAATAAFPTTANPAQPVVLHSTGASLSDPALRAAVQASADAIARVPHVTGVSTPYQAGHHAQLSADGTIATLTVTFDVSGRQLTPSLVHQVVDATAPATAAGVTVIPGGSLADALQRPDTLRSEVLGLLVAAIVLLLAFRSWRAMLVTLGNALVGMVITLGLTGLLGHLIDTPSVAVTLATMIGLGVGIDYALFAVVRYRKLLAAGAAVEDALAAMLTSSGTSVAFAGCTVIVSLAGLWLAGLPLVGVMGTAAGVAVLVAIVAALTLLPAVLGLLGERLRPPAASRAERASGWGRLAGGVRRRPWRTLAASLVVLATLAAPVLSLSLGQLDAGSFPTSQASRQAYDLISRGFGPGANGPLLVTVTLPSGGTSAVTAVSTALVRAGVASVSPAQVDAAGDLARWQVTPTTSPSDPATATLVTDLRDRTLPSALAGTSSVAHVGGQTAAKVDLTDIIGARLPLVVLVVVLTAGLLLLLAFRSPLVSLKAAVVNLISVGAAYGALVAVFSWGWGVHLLGLDGPVPIEGYVPLIMFAVLFGLSMDYEVFLVSAIRERFLRSGDNGAAVQGGVGDTGRVISSAALIMVAIFASFVGYPDPVVKMFGIGLAVAVAVDATIVRGLLVPATMVLLGRATWWIPRWLDRVLPHLDVHPEAGVEGVRTAGAGAPSSASHVSAAETVPLA
ncbi:membrane protein YdfJ [mine drainage metagenome]|uniref:Membrane protein YdfJ n=1 Tax=mine drainage metagenome TaxID=410659 RepID=A0A1J5QG51_9ZZZZ